MKKVKLYRGTIVIPTYETGPADAEPPLIKEFTPRGAPIYPYKTQETLSSGKHDRVYQSVLLENEYIKLTFLPELNGRLYSAFDKVNENELFYANPVIKPGLFAVRGAWPAVGVEFNFPNSHTTTTLEEITCTTREYEDGSASVIVGDIECTCRMGWSVEIKLNPESNAIEMESKLYNPTDFSQRYYYWINAACPVFGDTEFIYPPSTKRLLTHPPMDASRLAFLDWPEHEGCKINFFKNIRQHFPVFAEKMEEDFYGIYHHNKNYGLVHVADHALVRGRKLWMFGNARDGKIFIDLLSDESADYCEMQTGPFTLQSDYRLLHPGRMYVQHDYWLPAANTGGFNHACREFVVKVDIINEKAVIALCSTVKLKDAQAVVKVQDRIVDTFKFNAEPGISISMELVYSGNSEIQFIDNSGQVLSVCKPVEHSNNPEVLEHSAVCAGNDFLRGKYLEEQGAGTMAEKVYENAPPDDMQSKLAAARLACGNGQIDKADKLLCELLSIDRNNAEALLLWGNINLGKEHFKAADKAYSKAADDNRFRDRALLCLARLAIVRRQYRRAYSILQELIKYGSRESNIYALEALCLRKLNLNNNSSLQNAENIFFITPLLIGEKYFAAENSSYERQLVFEAVCEYIKLTHFGDAIRLLNIAAGSDGALSKYFSAWLTHRTGNENEARTKLESARHDEWGDWFAFRNETEPVLRYAVQVNSDDDTANYQLGCLLAYKNRWDEAVPFWERVKGSELSNALRNQALYYWRIKHDYDLAAKYFELAMENTCGSRTLIEAETFFEETGAASKLIAIFDRNKQLVEQDSRVKLSFVKALLANDKAQEACDIMVNSNFSLCEGKMLSRELYEKSYNILAEKALMKHDFSSAAEYYLSASGYPENIGIGKPSGNKEAEWYFKAGEAYTQAGMNQKASDCYTLGAEKGIFLDIPFFPLKTFVWETGWEKIDLRYWKNLLYRAYSLQKINKQKEASEILLKIERYLNFLKETERRDYPEAIHINK